MRFSAFIPLLAGVVFSCTIEEDIPPPIVKLDYYIEYFNLSGLDYSAQYKVSYYYDNSGKLTKYTLLTFDPALQTFVEQRHYNFTYVNGKVAKIEGLLAGSNELYAEYSYQYLPDSKVSKIIEGNEAAQLTSEATFTYSGDSVKVAYRYSNGSAFEYRFLLVNKNISGDKTTRGSLVCSNGQYTYDQYKNPFSSLGYVDYQLFNLSNNNKLTENVNYANCSFPTFAPESYSYIYETNGYPTESTTIYKSPGVPAKSQKKFFYKLM